jgi:hypothetical protein
MNKASKITCLIILILSVAHVAFSQCAMCAEVADEAARHGNHAGDGINKGVLYLFLAPYLTVGTIGLIWWRIRRRAQQALLLENTAA